MNIASTAKAALPLVGITALGAAGGATMGAGIGKVKAFDDELGPGTFGELFGMATMVLGQGAVMGAGLLAARHFNYTASKQSLAMGGAMAAAALAAGGAGFVHGESSARAWLNEPA